jgi:hypothetical protein
LASAPPPYPVRQRSWFERHLVLIVCFAGSVFVALIALGVFAVFWSLGESQPVQLALEIARTNPQVVARLGEPIERGKIVTGNLKATGGGNADAELSFSLSGPKGSGRVNLAATECAREWKFQTLEITFAGYTRATDLLKEASDTLSGASVSCPAK